MNKNQNIQFNHNFICPICKISLRANRIDGEIYWNCDNCLGFMVNLAVLRSHLSEDLVKDFWIKSKEMNLQSNNKCPSCNNFLSAFVVYSSNDESIVLDLCQSCQLMWFDKNEMGSIPKKIIKYRIPQKIRDEIITIQEDFDSTNKIDDKVKIALKIMVILITQLSEKKIR